jgi:hypothetical protein
MIKSVDDRAFTCGNILAHAKSFRHRVMKVSIGLNVGIGFESQQSALPIARKAYAEMI